MSLIAADPLGELRWHWGSAYVFARPRPDIWVAQRRDDRSTFWADSPDALHNLVVADYTARPSPARDRPGRRREVIRHDDSQLAQEPA